MSLLRNQEKSRCYSSDPTVISMKAQLWLLCHQFISNKWGNDDTG